ncbi:MAG: hypothetical protein M1812_004598 [Candelaria pacifica]|nr:MAG: hypothetical protein M1812_004598 [Candelaria pacifica]
MSQKDRRRRQGQKLRKAKEMERAPSKTHRTFLDLPGELRNDIYDYVIKNSMTSEHGHMSAGSNPLFFDGSFHRHKPPVFIQTRIQIHQELSTRILFTCWYETHRLGRLVEHIRNKECFKSIRYLHLHALQSGVCLRRSDDQIDLGWTVVAKRVWERIAQEFTGNLIELLKLVQLKELHIDFRHIKSQEIDGISISVSWIVDTILRKLAGFDYYVSIIKVNLVPLREIPENWIDHTDRS